MLKRKRNKTDFEKYNSFLFRLRDILNDNTSQDIITWNSNGPGIIIKDTHKLCDTILPKFFKHNNYSSFVRQLNLYGFHKSKGISKEGDIYEHEKFNKESTKEQIEQMMKSEKKNKKFSKYIKENIQTDILNNDENGELLSINNEEDILKYLINKNEENVKCIIELKKEIGELKSQNKNLVEQIDKFKNNFYGHNVFLEKFLKQRNKNKKTIVNKKVHTLKELFRKYLYYLRIYSPYLIINNNNNGEYRIQKADSFNLININNGSNNLYNINSNISNNNNNSFYGGFQLLNQRQDMHNFFLNLLNKNSSSSFLYNKNGY